MTVRYATALAFVFLLAVISHALLAISRFCGWTMHQLVRASTALTEWGMR